MEQHTGTHELLLSNPLNAFTGAVDWGDALFDGQCSSEDTTRLPLVGWVPDPDGNLESTAMPTEWLQQFSVTLPNISSPPATMALVEQQYAAPSAHWLHATSFASSTDVVGFGAGSSPGATGQWDASALATSTDGYVLQLDGAAAYPLVTPEAELTSPLPTAVHWHHNDWPQPGQYWPCSPSEYDSDHNLRKREAQPQSDGVMETWDGKRRRLTQTTLDTNLPRYLPTPELNSPNSVPDATHMQTTPPPMNSITTPTTSLTITPDTGNSHLTPTSQTTSTSTTTPSPTAATSPTTTFNPTTPPKKPTVTRTSPTSTTKPPRNRNRAAASRYRANKQAACAQLAAEEREARTRHESLLACANQLREEVFRLKSELLRHAGAGCECPLIKGYLKSAAEEAWVRRVGSISSSEGALGISVRREGLEGDASGC